jgi:hypothetical protein
MPGGEPVRLLPGGGSGRPLAVAGLIAAIIGLGLLKPWGNEPAASPALGPIAASPASAEGRTSRATPDGAGLPFAIHPAGSQDPPDDTSGPCYYGRAWRLFTTEPSDVGIVRTWYALAPVEAVGPTDSRISAIVIHSNTIDQLGYCSVPQSAQGAVVATSVWRLAPGAPPVAIAPEPIGPAGSATASGVIFTPPTTTLSSPAAGSSAAGPVPSWSPAEYVFVVRLADSNTSEWFAVEIAQPPPSRA